MLARVPWSPPTPTKPKPRVLAKDRRRHLVSTVAGIMRDGRPTYFAYEGACRHGLRSSLCLQGWTWAEADAAAADIVEAALRQLGARRPTWQQGQLNYVEDGVEREHCRNGCGKRVAIGRYGHPRKYCSDWCQKSYTIKMHLRYGAQRTRAEYLAACAADRARKAEAQRDCAWCGKLFTQVNRKRSYCSDECANEGRRKAHRTVPDRPCAICSKMFKPNNPPPAGKYCSRACMASAYRVLPEKPCERCREPFRLKEAGQRYCSAPCARSARFRCQAA